MDDGEPRTSRGTTKAINIAMRIVTPAARFIPVMVAGKSSGLRTRTEI